MSSMRNAVQRRNHKERAQPLGREKWGLLEKHKDYALRAKDHKDKQKRLKILKEKAVLANPDEFSFKMMSSKTKNGQRIADRGNKALSMDVVRLLKTQDAGYIRTMLQRTRKEREKLEMEVQLESEGKFLPLRGDETEGHDSEEHAKRIAFVESREEQRDMLVVKDDDAETHTLGSSKRLSRKAEAAKRQAEIAAGRAQKKRAHQHEVRRDLLEAVRKREDDLVTAEQELELQRAKMSHSIGGVNKQGLKFKIRERKR